MDSKISVIIPVYNAESTVVRCVESLIYGDLRDIEVILVDDCSKDKSWQVCQNLAKQYDNVHCIQNEENRGVSYTRNQGLKKAKSDYILFVDSDDWVSGRYASTLLEVAKEYPDDLVICGLHFHDNVAGYKRDYLWDESGDKISVVGHEQFFELQFKFLIQQLWNKIFRRDIIEQVQILFDEAQSMGEDFQFVLDYMEAIQSKKCVVINKPLYYYIRANNTSLMKQFGLNQSDEKYKRNEQLLRISGEDNLIVRERYELAMSNTKHNCIRQIVRDQANDKNTKINLIDQIVKDGKARQYYYQQKHLMLREGIAKKYNECKQLPRRVKDKVRREKNAVIVKKMRTTLKENNFTIISQNCIGGVFYHDMNMPFTSPTINLYFKGDDFVRFVGNLRYYLNLELEMYWKEEYPIGMLGDITIYFMHFHTCTEAKEAWEKRKKRINYENIIVLCTDMEAFTKAVYEEWRKIPYPKVLFTANQEFAAEKGSVYYSAYSERGKVDDLIPNREFYKDDVLIKVINGES